jgi:hypothetical protein
VVALLVKVGPAWPRGEICGDFRFDDACTNCFEAIGLQDVPFRSISSITIDSQN